MVDARDAIYKEFLFTNFNQVCVHMYQGSRAGTVTIILYGLREIRKYSFLFNNVGASL